MDKIYFRHRNDNKLIEEKVPGFFIIQALYSKKYATPLRKCLVANSIVSSIYGKIMSSRLSKKNIKKFVFDYDIDMTESKKSIDDFDNFNDFFIRELHKNARPIATDPLSLISPADGKILVYDTISESHDFFVKGTHFDIRSLLQDDGLASHFQTFSMAIIRLAPVDYHRFHFPLSGLAGETQQIKGAYYSVSPIALTHFPKIYTENKRTVCQIKNTQVGSYLFLEVGATMVGSIVQTYKANTDISRGDEKGYFRFGGSTVILIFRTGTVGFDDDIMKNSAQNIETKVQMGEKIGFLKQ
jgi:phosphatidylserine decarboxylase